jgi:hypothetical protein
MRRRSSCTLAASRLLKLGPGHGEKLATLIENGRRGSELVHVHLIDVSRGALSGAARTLSALPDVHVHAHEMSYEAGLLDLLTRHGPVAPRWRSSSVPTSATSIVPRPKPS